MAAFKSSCAKRIGKPGLGKSDTSRSLGNYGCMLVQKIGKSTVIQINKVTKRLQIVEIHYKIVKKHCNKMTDHNKVNCIYSSIQKFNGRTHFQVINNHPYHWQFHSQ